MCFCNPELVFNVGHLQTIISNKKHTIEDLLQINGSFPTTCCFLCCSITSKIR